MQFNLFFKFQINSFNCFFVCLLACYGRRIIYDNQQINLVCKILIKSFNFFKYICLFVKVVESSTTMILWVILRRV
jgi:hypothetical protein